MTLQSSGVIKFSEIQTEFGGSNPVSASEYYAGGAYVPGSTSGVNGAVPTSGTLSMSKFYGTSSVIVAIADANVTATKVASGAAVATYHLYSTGDINRTVNSTTTDIGDWVSPKSAAAGYEVYATLTAGTLTSGTTGSWLALTSNRSWNVSRAVAGESDATITVQIRKTGTTTVLATATVTLTAIWEP